MRKSFKYRLYPSKAHVEALTGQLRGACNLYNQSLEERITAWKNEGKSLNYYDQANRLKQLRADGLVGVSNFSCCQDVLRRLNKTFSAFFSRIKKGQKPGFPRFKPNQRYDTLTFPSYGDGCKLIDKLAYIQGVGKIKVKLHRPVEGKIKTVSIKREAGRWFAIFSVECEPIPLPISTETVGIDVGLTSFATFDDGTTVDNPRFTKEAERKLRVANRRLARRKKGSNRRRKAVQILQRQYAHIQNQRSNFHHNVSRSIVNRYGFIAVEDLNIKGLAGGMLAKSVHDAGWGSFLNMLAYKAESAGREFVKVDPRGTSQTCLCGAKVPKKLWDRWHSCSVCGLERARDHVSAQLILRLGLSLRSSTWPDVGACVLREAVCFS
jgi:putative transposase